MPNVIPNFHGQYRWLSNFALSPVLLDGQTYPTVEHAYQASKTVIEEERALIIQAPSPGRAKKMGRPKDKGGILTLRKDWCEDFQLKTMRELLQQKFSMSPWRELLLETGDAELIEGNTWGDFYWGKVNGVGKNQLGFLIMQIRKKIRDGDG